MLKKILPFLIIILLVVPIGLFWFFFKDKQIPDNRIDAIEAVPVNSIFALETRAFPNLLQLLNAKKQIVEDLGFVPGIKPYLDGIRKIDSLLIRDKVLFEKLNMVPGVFCLNQTGDKKFDPLLVLQTNDRVAYRDMIHLGQALFGLDAKHSEKSYERIKIHSLSYGEGSLIPEYFIASLKKYLIISTSDILIEEVIRQVKIGTNLNALDEFKEAAAVAGQNADANLYLNLKRFSELGTEIMHPALAASMKEFIRYGSWMELDMSLREDILLGSGFAFRGDTVAWLDLFEGEAAQKNQIDQVLPANTQCWIGYGIENPEKFFKKLQSNYRGTQLESKRKDRYSQISREIGEDLQTAFAGFVENEVGIAWISGKNDAAWPLVIVGTRSQAMAFDKLENWLLEKARREGKKIQDFRFSYHLDAEKQHYIYQMPVSGIPEQLFGNLFSSVSGKYFSFSGNYLLIADEREAIEDALRFKELNKTLNTDPVYLSVIDQIGMRNNFVFYISPFRAQSFLASRLNPSWSKQVQENEEFIKRMGAVSLQIQSANTKYYHNFFVRFSDSEIDEPQTLWESRLDTTLNFKPVFITNHNTHQKEIFLQDEGHTLYLVNTLGRVLWRQPLNEAINSEIFQIDIYKNGKLQFLFSTKSALHLIDRNGNYVDKYPVRLRVPASNGMSLFDYDGRKDYRIFIAGTDKQVYVYDKNGSLVDGWEFKGSEGLVTGEIQHLRIGSKDYIVFADPMRVYILDRRGDARVTQQRQFAKSINNPLILDQQSSKGARLVTTDVEGTVWYTYFDGRVEEQKLSGYSADHYFAYEDVDGDARKDFVFADQDRLEVLSQDGKRIFLEKTAGKITHAPNIYTFPGNSKEIGIVNRNEERIYLFQSNGKQHEGFPLRGRTPFSIGYLDPGIKQFNLIVGGDDKFLLNYRVN